MEITPITRGEFLDQRRGQGRALMAETKAVVDLEQGTGIKFPCRWNHQKNGGCVGVKTIRAAAIRHGLVVKFKCKDGNLHVWMIGKYADLSVLASRIYDTEQAERER